MDEKIKELLKFLQVKNPEESYTVDNLRRYHRIIDDNRAAYCFIVKEDFSNKTVGNVKAGDLMFPKTWSQPARHPRGNLFNRESWGGAFGKNSMTYLR
ncbi:MAG: hypothetical protein GY710_04045 [Desulfobacteraceae bacterium]|nr:hypothetical protein [Desulfobacteraceae bacterium]